MRISDWSSDVCSSDLDNVIHVAGRIDPISDIEVINTELALADLASAEKALQRNQKTARAGDKEAIKMVALLEKIIPVLNEARPIRSLGLDDDDQALIKQIGRAPCRERVCQDV